jgi:hypothetical protein
MSAHPNEQRFGAVERELGPTAAMFYDRIGSSSDALEESARAMWRAYGDSRVTDDEATFLGAYIDRRRSRAAPEGGRGRPPIGDPAGRCLILRFPKRKPQRAPDRQQAYERRHRLAYSGVMPRHLAAKFTVGAMSCFRVIADEIKARGFCDLSLAEIAARGGVCRKTVKRALEAAGRWGERLLEIKERPRSGRKHLTNLVTIVSKEWLAWLARKPAVVVSIGGHSGAPTDKSLNDDLVGGRENRRANGCEEKERCHPKSEGGTKPCPIETEASAEAVRLANKVAVIAGYRLHDLPQSWTDANPEVVVQAWLNTGWASWRILSICQWVMSRKKDGPPFSPRYFTREITKLGLAPIAPTRAAAEAFGTTRWAA